MGKKRTGSSKPLGAPDVQEQNADLVSIREGLAHILVPKQNVSSSQEPKNGVEITQTVFYNPIQQFNRDLSVLAVRAYADDLAALRKAKFEAGLKRHRAKASRGLKRKAEALDQAPEEAKFQPAISNDDLRSSEDQHEIDVEQFHEQLDKDNTNNIDESFQSKNQDNHISEADSKAHDGADPEINPQQSDAFGQPRSNSHFKLTILDALSASGLRAIRYNKELPYPSHVVANDMSPEAAASINANIKHNNIQGSVTAVTGNAIAHMYKFAGGNSQDNVGKYDVIDLDPYGTAIPFIDAALYAVKNGGLLCVTFTDAGVWASHGYPEKTFALYGGAPIRGLHSHEGGLRLILHSIATAAARQGTAIEPLLSLSIDFYARVFVRVRKSPADVKFLAGKTMLVFSCDSGCGAWKTQFLARNQSVTARDGNEIYKHTLAQGPSCEPTCEHCGSKTHISGPMYGGPLHNSAFIETILRYLPDLDQNTYVTKDRIEGMLSMALEENTLQDDVNPSSMADENKSPENKRPVPPANPAMVDQHPFFFVPSVLAKVLHCQSPPEAPIKGALRHAGYKVVRSHTKPTTMKTNAPWSFIWEMMREWVRQHAPIKEGAIKPGTAGDGIMKAGSKQPKSTTGEGNDQESEAQDKEGLGSSYSAGEVTQSQSPRIVFDKQLGQEVQKKGLVRYQVNPRANWGPMNRAKVGS